jgi:hypothetical protein
VCKYCEKELEHFDVDNSLNGESVVMTAILDTSPWNSNPYIQMEATVYAGVFGTIDIESSFEVNYCPVCGRKLKKDNV